MPGLAVAAAAFAFVGVALGAFAAHALASRLEPRMLEIFETAVRYHLIHAVAALAVAAMPWRQGLILVGGWSYLFGVVVFSGSLYLLVLTGTRWLGAVTPLGGHAFLAGHALVAVGVWRATAA